MSIGNRPHLKKDAYGNTLQLSYGDNSVRGQSDGSGNIKLIGVALPGSAEDAAVWQIRELMFEDDNLKSQKFPKDPDGLVSTQYIFKWSERDKLEFL